jgi:exodeoxyribonuclease V alpha subunit
LADHHPETQQVEDCIQTAIAAGELVGQKNAELYEGQNLYYAPAFFQAEYRLSQRLRELLLTPVVVDLERVQNWIDRFVEKTGMSLSAQQRQAVEMSASHRILILTGGPGTGKTFTTRTIVALWKAMGKEIALASPTGRAAQRLSEMTGREAKTIHRLLEFDPKTMQFNRDLENPLPAEAIVIDESSMMDLFLANSAIKACDLNAQLLLVGDTDQLPSVGPGNVLGDLIASGVVPVVKLTEVFRQAAASQIVSNAHRINQGIFPKLEPVSGQSQSDCLWVDCTEPVQGVPAIEELVSRVIPALGFNSALDVQVLCPMTRGEMGTRNLNQVIQALVNPAHPSKKEMVRGGTLLRVGDRVIQKVNDYNREVFNGDLGVIEDIDLEELETTVRFDQRLVTYDLADLNEIGLAWAVTIHKSQGSEYPVVILPIFMQHYMMLSRNLIYTGLTRAKQLAILVGSQKAIGLSVRQVKDRERYTLLDRALHVP